MRRVMPGRRGCAELATLMEKGEAAWCAAVRLELWTGIQHQRERRVLRQFRSVKMSRSLRCSLFHMEPGSAPKARDNDGPVAAGWSEAESRGAGCRLQVV
jgi:hypothetical protein